MLAGVESFAQRGYHATTTRDIASNAGMSPAALYVHFPSKAALLFEISRSGHEQALNLVASAAEQADDPVEAMREIVERFVAWHARRHTVARVVRGRTRCGEGVPRRRRVTPGDRTDRAISWWRAPKRATYGVGLMTAARAVSP